MLVFFLLVYYTYYEDIENKVRCYGNGSKIVVYYEKKMVESEEILEQVRYFEIFWKKSATS
jgi:hypothetical protein